MNRLLIGGLVVLLSCSAHAGGNPNVRIYIDFDPPNYVHEFTPAPYTTASAYVCLDGLDTGAICISFRMAEPDPSVCVSPYWTILWPVSLPIWWTPWEDPGATVASIECVLAECQPTAVGRIDFFYLGGSACLEILDHLDYPRWVVDCEEPVAGVDYYCTYMNGSVGGGWCPEGDCPQVAVESASWGTIKSLYR